MPYAEEDIERHRGPQAVLSLGLIPTALRLSPEALLRGTISPDPGHLGSHSAPSSRMWSDLPTVWLFYLAQNSITQRPPHMSKRTIHSQNATCDRSSASPDATQQVAPDV